jgi:hypothetical protein
MSSTCEGPNELANSEDGCCPGSVGAADDGGCARCGDLKVGPGESCDPPSSCPTQESCLALSKNCIQTRFSGDPTLCTARCELLADSITVCKSEDECCPAGCDRSVDSDCPEQCGDGKVDTSAGETCEPESRSLSCDIDCDDQDPCTVDMPTGSARNCNVRCSQRPIVQPADGDQCCPPGANAVNDKDCRAVCGNGVMEPGEQCDGGDGCDSNCQAAAPECPGPSFSDACRRCTCTSCPAETMGCYRSGLFLRNIQCAAAVGCGLTNQCVGACTGDLGCLGRNCWFGTGFPDTPAGACVMPIQAAAGGDAANVVAASGDSRYALYHAEHFLTCVKKQCATECEL